MNIKIHTLKTCSPSAGRVRPMPPGWRERGLRLGPVSMPPRARQGGPSLLEPGLSSGGLGPPGTREVLWSGCNGVEALWAGKELGSLLIHMTLTWWGGESGVPKTASALCGLLHQPP